jgi:hypothetical protein
MKVLGHKTDALSLFLLRAKFFYENFKRAGSLVLLALFFILISCSTTEKPSSEMIFASAAIRAAERALAEKRAPDLYRRAEQSYWRAQRYFLARDFESAKKAAEETRKLAEKAEYSAELKASEEDEFYE